MKTVLKSSIINYSLWICFLLTVVLSAWVALDRIEKHTKHRAEAALLTVLNTVQEALRRWSEGRLYDVAELAATPEVRNLTIVLLDAYHKKSNLISHPALRELRDFVAPKLERYNDQGIFVIAPDRVSIASMRDENIGTINLMELQRKSHLDSAFKGNTVFVPTIRSDVPLLNSLGISVTNAPTLFVLSPVRGKGDEVIAVLSIRVDPTASLTQITKHGRIGETGETYAFDESGVLISESRFDDQLKRIGLIEASSAGVLNIKINDPGINLLHQTDKFNISAKDLDLTLMAKSATARSADTNTDGYRDYRGVTVFGAWLWDNDMGIGLAVEIDKSESLQPYFYARFTLAIVITIVVLLTVLLFYFQQVFYFQQAREREKQKLFKATVRATQHILNNLINQMQLFKMEADRTQAFDERIKKLFMESLQEGQDLVSRLGRVSEITEDAISKSVAPK